MNKFLILLLAVFSFSSVFATDIETPPPPPPPTPFPGLPLDGGLFILYGVALLLGFYLIKKYNFTKKSSL